MKQGLRCVAWTIIGIGLVVCASILLVVIYWEPGYPLIELPYR